tara:strand:+ start:80 stop:445 length:366 start_codon:yes stop_codon:yes gene_type:complete
MKSMFPQHENKQNFVLSTHHCPNFENGNFKVALKPMKLDLNFVKNFKHKQLVCVVVDVEVFDKKKYAKILNKKIFGMKTYCKKKSICLKKKHFWLLVCCGNSSCVAKNTSTFPKTYVPRNM